MHFHQHTDQMLAKKSYSSSKDEILCSSPHFDILCLRVGDACIKMDLLIPSKGWDMARIQMGSRVPGVHKSPHQSNLPHYQLLSQHPRSWVMEVASFSAASRTHSNKSCCPRLLSCLSENVFMEECEGFQLSPSAKMRLLQHLPPNLRP